MRFAVLSLCLAFLFGTPALTGIELTKTGPMVPQAEVECHGGAGGPAMDNKGISEFC